MKAKWTWLTIAIMVLLAVGLAAITSSCRGKKADNSDVIAELRIQVAVMKQQLIKYHQTSQPVIKTIPAQPLTAPAKVATHKTEVDYSAVTRRPSAEQQLPNRKVRPAVEIQDELSWLRRKIQEREVDLSLARDTLTHVREPYCRTVQRAKITRLEEDLGEKDMRYMKLVAELQQVTPPPQQANVTVKAYVVKVATNGTKAATTDYRRDGTSIVIIHNTNTTAKTQIRL